MKIAIASGKGGAGKTTLATSLVLLCAQRGLPVMYLDCDVEEPNGHLFLHPTFDREEVVTVPIPQIDEKACRTKGVCGKCGKTCQFKAIVCILDVVVVNPDLCHGCGACVRVCPAKAITEIPHRVGVIETGIAGKIRFIHGKMDIGQAMATPIIRQLVARAPTMSIAILDAPPGTTCPTVETLRGCDLVLLVAEATPFGFHDFTLAVEMTQSLNLRVAAVVNRIDGPIDNIRDWCRRNNIPILGEILADRRVAEAYARGEMPLLAVPEFRQSMETIAAGMMRLIGESQS